MITVIKFCYDYFTFASAVLGGGGGGVTLFLYELFSSLYIYCALNIFLHITILQVEVC